MRAHALATWPLMQLACAPSGAQTNDAYPRLAGAHPVAVERSRR
jgi:hypothetical protein